MFSGIRNFLLEKFVLKKNYINKLEISYTSKKGERDFL